MKLRPTRARRLRLALGLILAIYFGALSVGVDALHTCGVDARVACSDDHCHRSCEIAAPHAGRDRIAFAGHAGGACQACLYAKSCSGAHPAQVTTSPASIAYVPPRTAEVVRPVDRHVFAQALPRAPPASA